MAKASLNIACTYDQVDWLLWSLNITKYMYRYYKKMQKKRGYTRFFVMKKVFLFFKPTIWLGQDWWRSWLLQCLREAHVSLWEPIESLANPPKYQRNIFCRKVRNLSRHSEQILQCSVPVYSGCYGQLTTPHEKQHSLASHCSIITNPAARNEKRLKVLTKLVSRLYSRLS